MDAAVATVPIFVLDPTTVMPPARAMLRDVSRGHVLCSGCSVRDKCLSEDLDASTANEVDKLVTTRIRLRKGDTLYSAGASFTALYAIRSGSLKTVLSAEDGRDQIAGYHMQGELLGLDGIGNEVHQCQAIAMEDSQVCVLPFGRIERLAREFWAFQHNVHRMLAKEIARQRSLTLLLGTMRAEQRLAAFLFDLLQRYQARGYSSSEVMLRMTREEIGSYLGLKLETVSRLLSRMQRKGLIQVQGRKVKVLHHAELRRRSAQPA